VCELADDEDAEHVNDGECRCVSSPTTKTRNTNILDVQPPQPQSHHKQHCSRYSCNTLRVCFGNARTNDSILLPVLCSYREAPRMATFSAGEERFIYLAILFFATTTETLSQYTAVYDTSTAFIHRLQYTISIHTKTRYCTYSYSEE